MCHSDEADGGMKGRKRAAVNTTGQKKSFYFLHLTED